MDVSTSDCDKFYLLTDELWNFVNWKISLIYPVYMCAGSVVYFGVSGASLKDKNENATRLKLFERDSSPFNISIVKTTDRTITIQWKLLPTCYDRVQNVVVVKSDNTTKEFKVDKDDTEFTIPDLQPSSSYDIKMYSDYGNGSSYTPSLATPLASVANTADERVV
ncbi:unnamed protein product [Mytilus edulis]|uniref:Fibronectin type-III domain-containing protein n=1 Tax=Mytilus edulis TaxID=6550 RepID=A0A8S3PQA6_MYTED|nr:unnamed protein product [Mytilus edulis]